MGSYQKNLDERESSYGDLLVCEKCGKPILRSELNWYTYTTHKKEEFEFVFCSGSCTPDCCSWTEQYKKDKKWVFTNLVFPLMKKNIREKFKKLSEKIKDDLIMAQQDLVEIPKIISRCKNYKKDRVYWNSWAKEMTISELEELIYNSKILVSKLEKIIFIKNKEV